MAADAICRRSILRGGIFVLGSAILATRVSASDPVCIPDHEAQEGLRQSLHYSELGPAPERRCAACAYFAEERQACGTCVIFTGPANRKGTCDSWSLRQSG